MKSKKIVFTVLLALLCAFSAVTFAACGDDEKTEEVVSLKFELSQDGKEYALAGKGNVKDAQITVPSTYNGLPVTSVKSEAFKGITAETKLTLPEGIKSIGDRAFYEFTGLKEIKLPASLTSIGSEAFFKCGSLTSVTLPDAVTSLGDRVFSGCTALASVNLEKLTSIGQRAFSGCAFTEIVLPDTLESLGNAAFGGCDKATKIVVPDGVRVQGTPFENCDAVTEVKAAGAVVSDILRFARDTVQSKVTVTSGIIPQTAFMSCQVQEVIIGKDVTKIEAGAFSNVIRLDGVKFESPDGWTVQQSDSDTPQTVDVSDPATNAANLSDPEKYRNYIWSHEAE